MGVASSKVAFDRDFFTIVTDCQCLVNINEWKTKNPQISRWISEIAEYTFKMRHQKATQKSHADALSRAPVEEAFDSSEMPRMLSIDTREDEILIFQRSDL